MLNRHTILRLSVFVFTWLVATVMSSRASQIVLIGPDLKPRPVTIQSLRDGTVTYFDQERNLQVEAVGELLQVRQVNADDAQRESPETQAMSPDHVLVELSDGQRLSGRWLGADREGQALQLLHPLLGQASIPLETLRLLERKRSTEPRVQTASDRVKLVNGDTIEGFVSSVHDEGVALQLTGQAEPIVVPLTGIASVQLTNPPMRRLSGHMVWLTDGSRLLVRDVVIDGPQVKLFPALLTADKHVTVSLQRVMRIEVENNVGRVADLADQAMIVTAGGTVFGGASPPRVRGGDVKLHAPITIRIDLPAGTRRLAGVVELAADEEITDWMRAWSDMDLVVLIDGKEQLKVHLDANQPRQAINLAVDGLSLELRLETGLNGPVMDRMTLKDVVLFIAR